MHAAGNHASNPGRQGIGHVRLLSSCEWWLPVSIVAAMMPLEHHGGIVGGLHSWWWPAAATASRSSAEGAADECILQLCTFGFSVFGRRTAARPWPGRVVTLIEQHCFSTSECRPSNWPSIRTKRFSQAPRHVPRPGMGCHIVEGTVMLTFQLPQEHPQLVAIGRRPVDVQLRQPEVKVVGDARRQRLHAGSRWGDHECTRSLMNSNECNCIHLDSFVKRVAIP